MTEGVAEWELCKENGRPGRADTSLPQEGSSQAAIQQQKRSFELELCNYTGDDPLDVWDRYIRWVLQTYPQGGKESNLNELLQRSVLQLVDEKKYHDDARYVDLWIKLAQNTNAPGDTFSYMQGQGVGLAQAALYIAWSEEFEKHGDFQKADDIVREGLRCGARPPDTLQQYHEALLARMSVREEEEPVSPLRTSMVDLRPRGKRKAQVTSNRKTAPAMILDENQGGPSMGSDVERPRRACSDGTNKASFQPLIDESDRATSASNAMLSGGQPSKEEGGVQEQSMYCREQLMRGPIEFSIDELRAERYFQRKQQEYNERNQYLAGVKEQLSKELEEKRRLVLLRRSQILQTPLDERDVSMSEAETDSSMLATEPEPEPQPQRTVPFQIFDESQPGSVSTQLPGNPHPGQSDMSDDVFLHPGERGLRPVLCPRQGGRMPIYMYKSFANDEPIIYGHQNKTVCSSPDDTNDIARAAKLASTPYTGPLSLRTSSPDTGAMTEDLRALQKTPAPASTPQEKLSPIQEASLETWTSMASATTSLSSQGAQSACKTGHLSSLEESHQEQDITDRDSSPTVCPREDPCTLDVRKRLLDEMNVGALSNFHSLPSPIPTVEEGSVLLLGSENFLISSKVADGENFHVYAGVINETAAVMKVESSPVPWDFYIGCQVRRRLAGNPQAPTHPDISCYAFRNGCITVYKVAEQPRACSQTSDHWRSVVYLAIQLLELVRTMHCCSLLLGALCSDTLLSYYSNSAIMAVDLSSSIDLQLQPGVTSAQQLVSAWPFIERGLLEPSASPYQVDLLAVAETIHTLLNKSNMRLAKDDSGWTLEEYIDAKPSDQRKVLWKTFFQTLLNPSDKPSVSVLSELRDILTDFIA